LNITEDDLVRELKVQEIMDQNPPLIHKNMHLAQILSIFSESPNLYYPVVDAEKKLIGIVSVDNIKSTFMEKGLSDLLLAVDVMEPAIASVSPESSILELKRTLAKYNLEFLPVVDQQNILCGFVERRMVYKIISTKMMELQRQADSLEDAA